jgi:hypothetical protein
MVIGKGYSERCGCQATGLTDWCPVPAGAVHYEQMNPLSAPFWSQQGYRPLWTEWAARPAAALR